MKHIQNSRVRVQHYGKEASSLREGLRILQMDTMDLRVNLLAQPETEQLAPLQDASLLAAQFAAGSIVAALDTAVRVEIAFQAEMARWLKGLPPSTRVERLQVELQAARLGDANGKRQTPAIDAYQASATEVETPAIVVQGQEFGGDASLELTERIKRSKEEAAAAIEKTDSAQVNGST